jgi:hypothetical protein
VTTRSWLHPEKVEQKQARASAELLAREEIRWLMGNQTGRRVVWRLIDASKALSLTLANNTATIQSGLVAVRDFAMEQLIEPILSNCPELFLQMKAENDGSTAERAPNTN